MLRIEGFVQVRLINLLGFAGRVGQVLGEVSVVGQHDQALRFLVQSTSAKQAGLPIAFGQQVKDCSRFARIFVRADVASRFVHDEADGFGRGGGQQFPANLDMVVPGIDLLSSPSQFAVDRHFSKINQFLRLAARAYSANRKEFVNANRIGSLIRRFMALIFSG